MSSIAIGFVGLGAFLILLLVRLPVALAMIAVAVLGLWALLGIDPAIGLLGTNSFSFITSSSSLSSVPAFLLMGFVAYHAGLTQGLFEGAKVLLAKVPGALAISSILACSGFATVCGSSLATAAAMGKIAIPEMVRAGYKPSFATGCVAAGGTIGALIPPSILMIVYGVFAQTNVTKVFVGGIYMGLLTALSYIAVVLLTAWLRPNVVPRHDKIEFTMTGKQALVAVFPVLVLIAIVFGGLFIGKFTSTQAGGVAALAAIAICAVTGRLSFKVLKAAVLETLMTTSSLLMIGVGAAMFTVFMSMSGVTSFISASVAGTDLGYYQIMFIIVVVYLILGCFMEPFGAMMVTLPVFMPILAGLDVSMVWFGVFVVKLLEIGMITPPVGMNVFVIRNVAGEYASTAQIFRGVMPFFLADLVVVALAVVAPWLIV